MAINDIKRLYAYFIIYAIAQGIMDAYEEAIETPYLTRSGLDLSFIGIMQTIDFLPWCFKFLWAIPSDSYNFMGFGHRRPYVVLGLLLATVSFMGLAFFNPKPLPWLYMLLMIVRNIGIGIADCAVDGLSVDAEVDQESGALQGWMSLGRTVGTVLSCEVAGNIAQATSYKWAIVASACFVLFPIPANWFIQEEWRDEKAYADKVADAAVAQVVAAHKNDPPLINDRSKSTAFVAQAADALEWQPGGGKASRGGKQPAGASEDPDVTASIATGRSSARGDVEMAPASGALSPISGTGGVTARPLLQGVEEASDDPAPTTPGPEDNNDTARSGGLASAYDGEGDRLLLTPGRANEVKRLARRQSFVARVAVAAGFDWDTLQELIGQTHVWMFLLYICLTTLGVAVANFSLAAWLEEDHDFTPDGIGHAMSLMSIGCFMLSLPLGYLFDYVPQKRAIMFLAAASCAVCNLALAFCRDTVSVYFGLFGFGAAHGAIFVVQNSMARILADSRIAAAFFGIVNSCCNLMHALGTGVTGFIVEHQALPGQNDYILSYWVAAAIDIAAVLFVFLIPGDKLTVNHDEAGTKLKILPHRRNLKFTSDSRRRTVLNTLSPALQGVAVGGDEDGLSTPTVAPVALDDGFGLGPKTVFTSPLAAALRTKQAAQMAAATASARSPSPNAGSASAADQQQQSTTMLSGVVMSTSLAAFLSNNDSGSGSINGAVYVPVGAQVPPATAPITPARRRTLEAHGIRVDERSPAPLLQRIATVVMPAEVTRAPRPAADEGEEDGEGGSRSRSFVRAVSNVRSRSNSTASTGGGGGGLKRRNSVAAILALNGALPAAASAAAAAPPALVSTSGVTASSFSSRGGAGVAAVPRFAVAEAAPEEPPKRSTGVVVANPLAALASSGAMGAALDAQAEDADVAEWKPGSRR